MKKWFFALILAMSILCGCSVNHSGFYRCITQEEAKRMMDEEENIIVLDVRTEAEYKSGHIENAINIPVGDIQDTPPEQLPDKEQVILVYCRTGIRSKIASQSLADMGYKNIYEFGGIESWPYKVVW